MKQKIVFLIIIILLAGVSIFIFKKGFQTEPEMAGQEAQKAIPVQVKPVIQRDFMEYIFAVGTLKAHETNLISPKVPGNVQAVYVDLGDHVKAGKTLIQIDSTGFRLAVNQSEAAYKTAQAAIAQAESQFEQAEKEYRRAIKLLNEKVIPQSRFDAAEAAYKTAQEGLAVARGQYKQAQAVSETAHENLKNTSIRSVISGIIVERNVEIGQTIAPGIPVMRIIDQSRIKVDINLPEIDFGRVKIGDSAIITITADQKQNFQGKVTLVNPMVNHKTRTFQVRIEVSNKNANMVDGMFADVKLTTGKKSVLAVPQAALQHLPGSGTFYVFVVENNKASKRNVKTGKVTDLYTEVLSGLKKNDQVVVSGTGRLRSGIEVSLH